MSIGKQAANYYFLIVDEKRPSPRTPVTPEPAANSGSPAVSGTPGQRFRAALAEEKPLQIAGTPNALVAIMAERVGYRAVYLSGAGVANLSFGLPDLGVTTLDNVLEDARRITGAVGLPLLVDVDTGFGSELMIGRTVREMIRAGVAAIHVEDQVSDKRCGHRPGKALVSTEEMSARITAAVDARSDPGFVIMARTDAVAVEGLERALERAAAYAAAGADMIFPEALSSLEQYAAFKEAAGLPVLANLTEFGLTPSFTTAQLASAGVDMALYPLSASRAMNRAALRVLTEIRQSGTQAALVPEMMSRAELYALLGYEAQERRQRHG